MDDNNKPTFIHRDHVLNDDNYVQWLVDVKKRFRKNQIKAAVQVKNTMQDLYNEIGSMCEGDNRRTDFFNQLPRDTFEFLGISGEISEMELESKIAANITQFLLELGKGFAYVGRQMELQMPGGQTFFPDLVFYHIPQKRYLVIELKAVQFAPEFAGKINFYVNADDELLKGDGDNPTIGLIICRSYDKTTVEWSLRGVETPLSVAAYQLQEVVDRTVKELEMSRRKGK